jgi:hypothetical protein
MIHGHQQVYGIRYSDFLCLLVSSDESWCLVDAVWQQEVDGFWLQMAPREPYHQRQYRLQLHYRLSCLPFFITDEMVWPSIPDYSFWLEICLRKLGDKKLKIEYTYFKVKMIENYFLTKVFLHKILTCLK